MFESALIIGAALFVLTLLYYAWRGHEREIIYSYRVGANRSSTGQYTIWVLHGGIYQQYKLAMVLSSPYHIFELSK